MATGDQADIKTRLEQLLPAGWWTLGLVPVRDALLQGMANALAFGYALLAYVRLQTRILTASDGFLDMIAGDFLGPTFTRLAGQTDSDFRTRILLAMFRERNTRASVIEVLTLLTGRAPAVFEPARPADTGVYGGPGLGYGLAGGYGSLAVPMQSFVHAFRPAGTGIPNVAGYGISTFGYGVLTAQGEYAALSSSLGKVTDADIFAAVESVRPAGYTVWVAISP